MARSSEGGRRELAGLVGDNKSVTLVLAFLALSAVAGVVVDALGYPTVSGLIVSWAVVIVVATVVFVVVPIYALGFVE